MGKDYQKYLGGSNYDVANSLQHILDGEYYFSLQENDDIYWKGCANEVNHIN